VAYLSEAEVYESYELSTDEADEWRKEYPEYERLADNGLLEDLDENLPEVNDGSLAASLFKLAKRVIKKTMSGRAQALDRDDQWITELANIYWSKKILPNAKSKASPRRKWKDAVRKAAIFGGQPIITLFVTRGNYTGSDFIVPYAQDVKLEAGKDSDEDSDIIFWDVYYSRLQIQNMIEQAQDEMAEAAAEKKDWIERKKQHNAAKKEYDAARAQDPSMPEMPAFDEEMPAAYNKWNVPALQALLKTKPDDTRPGNQQSNTEQNSGRKKTGYHLFIAFQRGVDAPFMMCNPAKSKDVKNGWIRKWTNPDPTGDTPVHYLYCYQDFINPYGIGIVKLAGGTQNVLDYMRQADILATQVGIRPPKLIAGDEDDVDEESMVMAQDANWYVGQTQVTPWNMANGVYQQLPGRISMYQTSLQKMIPMGDTSISQGDSGDPQVSKVPAAVKLQAANLSIDDEDFSENVDECYEVVAASMINTQFSNMQGSDLLKLSDDERDILQKAGIPFNIDEETGEVPGEIEIIWDHARATFQFEMDADADKTTDDATKLEGLTTVANFLKDPTTQAFVATGQPIMLGSKKLDPGELIGEIIGLTTDNDKILTDVTPEEQDEAAAAGGGIDPATGQPLPPQAGGMPGQMPQPGQDPNAAAAPGAEAEPEFMQLPEGATPDMPAAMPGAAQVAEAAGTEGLTPEEQEAGEHIEMVKQLYGVDDHVAAAMLEAERQGYEPEEVISSMVRQGLIDSAILQKLKGQEAPQELVNA
jgi:hypothetical protein